MCRLSLFKNTSPFSSLSNGSNCSIRCVAKTIVGSQSNFCGQPTAASGHPECWQTGSAPRKRSERMVPESTFRTKMLRKIKLNKQ